ncbi:type IV secretory system conjugative DNA transfer family protein [Amycolatopsis nigrescens]|uniref:type IV secretory system conjugative DNA transfer family protein n=1 Tax=Amycolatopsis nigrescens TaxID=381445 RepID=UPI003CCBB4CD
MPLPAVGIRVVFDIDRLFASRDRLAGRPVERKVVGDEGLVVYEDPMDASMPDRLCAGDRVPRTSCAPGCSPCASYPRTPTLTDLPKLLTVPAFRQRALEQISDDVLSGFWTWYDDLSDASRAQVVAPLMNKLRGLLLRPFVRASLGDGESTVDMDEVLDGGICLVRLGKDALGMDTARLIGSIVVARTWQAATRRARIPQRDRRDASLYIDECHNFLNLAYPMEDMLAEARGYRMSMTLAHQYLRQLPHELEEGISTNARSKIIFSSSPEDARDLARHTAPRLSEHDLAHLGRFHIAARLVLNNEEAPPFTAVTEKLPPAIPGRAKEIRRLARVNTEPRNPPRISSRWPSIPAERPDHRSTCEECATERRYSSWRLALVAAR